MDNDSCYIRLRFFLGTPVSSIEELSDTVGPNIASGSSDKKHWLLLRHLGVADNCSWTLLVTTPEETLGDTFCCSQQEEEGKLVQRLWVWHCWWQQLIWACGLQPHSPVNAAGFPILDDIHWAVGLGSIQWVPNQSQADPRSDTSGILGPIKAQRQSCHVMLLAVFVFSNIYLLRFSKWQVLKCNVHFIGKKALASRSVSR